jgi:hypothetical protein
VQLHVRRALELLEDDVVQAAAGLHQRGAQQRQGRTSIVSSLYSKGGLPGYG